MQNVPGQSWPTGLVTVLLAWQLPRQVSQSFAKVRRGPTAEEKAGCDLVGENASLRARPIVPKMAADPKGRKLHR